MHLRGDPERFGFLLAAADGEPLFGHSDGPEGLSGFLVSEVNDAGAEGL
jgi:hypothetical protein